MAADGAPCDGDLLVAQASCETAVLPIPVVANESCGTDDAKPKSPLVLALLHLRWASFLQKASKNGKAAEHYALSIAQRPSARAYFGLGTCLAALRRREEAMEAFNNALTLSPHMVGAHVNLAGVLLGMKRFDESVARCRRALELEPGSREAVMNLANGLRNLGRRGEAVSLVWQHILEKGLEDASSESTASVNDTSMQLSRACTDVSASRSAFPAPIHCRDWISFAVDKPRELPIIVCLKWGQRYDSNYVNRLHSGVRKHLPSYARDAAFVCFTDAGEGIDESIEIRPLPQGLPLWWGKAHLFSEEAGLDGRRVLYLDLDQVIVGDMSGLIAYMGPFAVLSTDYISCELASSGYNSSVMAWEASSFFRPIRDRLSEAALRYVHRFDHWLEMNIDCVDLWHQVAPGSIVDYTTMFRGGICIGSEVEALDEASLHSGSFVAAGRENPSKDAGQDPDQSAQLEPPPEVAIVTFPRSPKPHEVLDHPWVRRHWCGSVL